MKRILGISTLIVFSGFAVVFGQDRTPARGVQAGNSYSISDIENVNLTNGNLMLNIPLATVPGGRGSGSGYTVSLRYDSKLWDTRREDMTNGTGEPDAGGYNYSREILKKGEHAGWKLDTGGYVLIVRNRLDQEPEKACAGPNSAGEEAFVQNGFIWRLEMRFPDGSIKEFRPYGTGYVYSDLYENGYFEISPNGFRSHHYYNVVNGNPICGTTDEQVTTAGMNYYAADGSGMRLYIPYNANDNWKLYHPNGTLIENLPTDDTNLYQRQTDRNGNKIVWKNGTAGSYSGLKIENDVGQFVLISGNSIVQPGFNGELIATTIQWDQNWTYRKYRTTYAANANQNSLFEEISEYYDVVETITLPTQAGGRQYRFTYNGAETEQSNQNYTNGFGELKSIELPSGAEANYTYQLDNPALVPSSCASWTACINAGDGLILYSAVTKRELTYDLEYDGGTTPTTETTLYDIAALSGFGSVTTPDGGVTTQSGGGLGAGGNYTAISVRPDGSKTENIWAQNKAPKLTGNSSAAHITAVNAYVKTEFTSIKDAGGSYTLTAIKDFDYDKNGNVLEVREYDWVAYSDVPRSSGKPTGIPASATLKRKTVNEYYNPTPIATDWTTDDTDIYANPLSPKLHNVVKSTETQDGSNTVKARSEFYYDDPNNKGNLIETRVWDSTKGALASPDSNGSKLNAGNSISTFAEYDQYGNVTKTTDAKGNQTQITYGSINGFTGLYPTQTISAYGTPVARTSTAVYDFYTGLVTTATDADNNVSTVMEYDALGRPTKVRSAANTALESWTRTEYDDINRRVVVRSDVEAVGDGRKAATQFYDQLGRVRLSKTLEDASVQSPYNETDGIKVQTRYKFASGYTYQLTSNPYRASTSGAETDPTMGWTLSTAWSGGVRSEVQTFSGSGLPTAFGGSNTNSTGIVRTDIDANATTVTDQAGKQRRSVTNALGQLARVDEPDAGGQLGTIASPNQPTYYAYDTLNNLITVNQGVQTRSFSYNSLSRLLSAANPESGTISYVYDNNGNLTRKTDARGVQTDYVYDALNRVTNRNYSTPGGTPGTGVLSNYQPTPNVSYFYDNLPNAKGKLIKVTNGTGTDRSTTEYTAFDILGRVTRSKQTTDGVVYGDDANPMTYTYNLAGALVEQQYPSGRVVKNVLDSSGDLSIVQSKKNAAYGFFSYAKNFTYNAAGALTSMQLGNGRWESTTFNSRLQPTQIALGVTQGTTNLLKLDYFYGNTQNNGNVQSQTITVPTVGSNTGFIATQAYNYDSLNRLKDATETIGGSQSWKQAYQFDRYGNRRFDIANTTTIPPGCAEAVCNPQISTTNNRLIGYVFDSSGNTTTDANGQTFTYDAENKQVKVQNGSQVIGEYFYDGDGKRVKKIVPATGEVTIFVYDASGKLVAEYSTIVASPQDAKVSYLTNDTLGSPRITTDQNGNVASRRDFMPYGEEIFSPQRTQALGYTVDTVRKQFTGYERDDESGLDFAQARMYANRLGRFSTVDSVGPDWKNPQTLNKFQYCLNNPLHYVDKNGKYDQDVHESLTVELAYAAGFSREQAKTIGRTNQWVDSNPETNPVGYGQQAYDARVKFHFTTPERRDELSAAFDGYAGQGDNGNTYSAIGTFFHARQDSYAHLGYGPAVGQGTSIGDGPILTPYENAAKADKTDTDPDKAEAMVEDTFKRLISARNIMAQSGKFGSFYRPISYGAIKDKVKAWVNEADPKKKELILLEIRKKIQNGRDVQDFPKKKVMW